MAIKYWTGSSANPDPQVGSNWMDGVVPVDGDTVIFQDPGSCWGDLSQNAAGDPIYLDAVYVTREFVGTLGERTTEGTFVWVQPLKINAKVVKTQRTSEYGTNQTGSGSAMFLEFVDNEQAHGLSYSTPNELLEVSGGIWLNMGWGGLRITGVLEEAVIDSNLQGYGTNVYTDVGQLNGRIVFDNDMENDSSSGYPLRPSAAKKITIRGTWEGNLYPEPYRSDIREVLIAPSSSSNADPDYGDGTRLEELNIESDSGMWVICSSANIGTVNLSPAVLESTDSKYTSNFIKFDNASYYGADGMVPITSAPDPGEGPTSLRTPPGGDVFTRIQKLTFSAEGPFNSESRPTNDPWEEYVTYYWTGAKQHVLVPVHADIDYLQMAGGFLSTGYGSSHDYGYVTIKDGILGGNGVLYPGFSGAQIDNLKVVSQDAQLWTTTLFKTPHLQVSPYSHNS